MDIHAIAKNLNIDCFPEQMNDIVPDAHFCCICDKSWVQKLEQDYQVFGDYYPLILQAAQQLLQDTNRLYWGVIAATYFAVCDVQQARQIPMPLSNGTLAGDFLPLLILMTQLESAFNIYKSRNMPADMIRRNFYHIVDGISIVNMQTGRPAINQTYFNWLTKFIKGTIFNCYGFNFEICKFPRNVYILQNASTNDLTAVLSGGTVHQSGRILHSAGCDDPEGSFDTVFEENEQCYIGYPCCNGIVEAHAQFFPKDQFRIILKPNEPVVSVHIPRGTDISQQNTRNALKAGFRDSTTYYPEHNPKGLFCHSWLLDPTFNTLLKPTARIPGFGNLFVRFPAKSAGNEVFSFVFNKKLPFHQLPENTSLERAIKKHYIEGNHILAYSGFILPELL